MEAAKDTKKTLEKFYNKLNVTIINIGSKENGQIYQRDAQKSY